MDTRKKPDDTPDKPESPESPKRDAKARQWDFWDGPSLDQIIESQGIKPIEDMRDLYGTWPGEVDDGFEEFIDALRGSGTPKTGEEGIPQAGGETMNTRKKPEDSQEQPLDSEARENARQWDFWNGPSIQELAKAQGVKPMKDIRELFGTWPGEVDDGFEEFIIEHRKSNLA